MICTEKEAAEKWCPHVGVLIGPDNARWQGTSFNTRLDDLSGPLSMNCIGSRCMSWRWAEDRVLRSYNSNETRPVVIGQTFDGSKWFMDESPSTTRGYCGLAGKP